MPRKARIFQKALCYHLINRGVNGRAIFRDEEDLARFTQTVKEYKQLCGAKVYHWCWMSTHYHMVAEVVFDNLRAFAGGIQQVHAQYFHRRHGTSGVFWQGRYKSKPVEIGRYLVQCGRYVERNPVRAKMVESAWDYRWSSANYYVGGHQDELSDRNAHVFPRDMTAEQREEYGRLLSSTRDDDWMKEQQRCAVLGSERFAQSLKTEDGRLRRKRGRPAVRAN